MSGVFLLILAVVMQSDKPKAQNPNDLIYENKPLSVWLNQLSDKDPKVRKSAAYAIDLGSKAKPQTGKDTPRLPRVLRVRPMNHIFPGMVTNRMRLRPTDNAAAPCAVMACPIAPDWTTNCSPTKTCWHPPRNIVGLVWPGKLRGSPPRGHPGPCGLVRPPSPFQWTSKLPLRNSVAVVGTDVWHARRAPMRKIFGSGCLPELMYEWES
jgi:hypothetical protein